MGPGLSSGALTGTPGAAPYTGPDKLGGAVIDAQCTNLGTV